MVFRGMTFYLVIKKLMSTKKQQQQKTLRYFVLTILRHKDKGKWEEIDNEFSGKTNKRKTDYNALKAK